MLATVSRSRGSEDSEALLTSLVGQVGAVRAGWVSMDASGVSTSGAGVSSAGMGGASVGGAGVAGVLVLVEDVLDLVLDLLNGSGHVDGLLVWWLVNGRWVGKVKMS